MQRIHTRMVVKKEMGRRLSRCRHPTRVLQGAMEVLKDFGSDYAEENKLKWKRMETRS